MKRYLLRIAVSLTALVSLFPLFTAQAQNAAAAPFRPGEVVVAGAPADLPAGLVPLKHLPNAGLTVVAAAKGGEQALAQRLRGQGRRAGVNRIAKASATVNDPFFSPYQWHFSAVQAEAAWDVTTGAGVTVAVLDTGLATGGPDGIGSVVAGWDIVNNDNDPDDGDGHGTHVAGTICQVSDNGTGGGWLGLRRFHHAGQGPRR